MKLRSDCIACIVNGCAKRIEAQTDEDKKALYMREILEAILLEPDNTSSPLVAIRTKAIYEKYFGEMPGQDFSEINRTFNRLVLEQMDGIEAAVRASEDPILTGIKYSLASNYIDYSAVEINNDELLGLLHNAAEAPLDIAEYPNLLKDLESATSLVFVHDNCGEIVVDKLLIKLIRERFPHLTVKACVRGGPALNDATREDAQFVGLDEVAQVFDTGNAVQGLPLRLMDETALNELRAADVIICKGQANFETTFDCGLNIYYLFMCKCTAFVRLFQLERFSCAFLNNLRLQALKEENGIRGGHEFPLA